MYVESGTRQKAGAEGRNHASALDCNCFIAPMEIKPAMVPVSGAKLNAADKYLIEYTNKMNFMQTGLNKWAMV